MSSRNQRRPSVSDWFSSLRRLPKNKKLNCDQNLQRSCINLSASTFYTDIYDDSEKKEETPIGGKKTGTCSESSIKKISTKEHQNFDLQTNCAITAEKDSTNNMIVINKKTEFKKVTTITRTTVLKQTRRIGLVFNDDGELITNLNQVRANSCNSLLENESYSPNKSFDADFMYIDDCYTSNDVNNHISGKECNSSSNLKNGSQIKDELCEVVSEMEALDSQEDCKHSNKDKQMSIGRKKFNMDPKKGIEFLVENHLLRMDPQDIAHFLYKGEGLNKTAIGDYLGEKNDFNEKVLKAFVELHDFTNLILVQALRQFLWSFRLPGEAQKIDRMMECFAQRYCQLNPDIFTNTDTCYVLSFAIIMLNTSLHNPSVKEKPTVEQFISMNRGINNGGDLPRGLLESLYESIRTEPFKIPQDDGNDLMHTFFNPDKEGWLWKQGGRYKSWKRRWFILNDNCLYYFEYTTDKEPRGIIPLENISVREIQDRNKPHCFELYACGGADIIKACKTDSEGKVVEGKHTVYRMSAATEEDKQEWIKRLTQSISHNPFYDILVQRKKKALAKS